MRGPQRNEGEGDTGFWPHLWALRAEECAFCARKQHRFSRNNRHSLRNGLRLIRDLLGAPGFLATVASAETSREKLDPSIGGSGPHDFAARLGITRQLMPKRPSHPVACVS